MKLAIHKGPAWNAKWIAYCEKNKIDYLLVDCYSPHIMDILKEQHITHLMWGFNNNIPKDLIVAQSVMNSAREMGIKTFPNYNDSWHFEDKIAQKYLLEAIDAPIVRSWAFFDEKDAFDFIEKTKLPIVAKLRKGAGAHNVILLKNKSAAIKYIKKMFSRGENPSILNKLILDKTKFILQGRKVNINIKVMLQKINLLLRTKHLFPKEIGYVYFQEFLPNNKNDLRIAIVGDRAWGFYRGVRKNDFRASGSGMIDYETLIPLQIIEQSFKITKRLATQSLCFDYVKDINGEYKIVEICYGYVSEAIYNSNGYWDSNMNFHEGNIMPDEAILNDFIS